MKIVFTPVALELSFHFKAWQLLPIFYINTKEKALVIRFLFLEVDLMLLKIINK